MTGIDLEALAKEAAALPNNQAWAHVTAKLIALGVKAIGATRSQVWTMQKKLR
jgi:hypothetical protein